MPHKTFKYRIYPTKSQVATLEWTLTRCCELYNAALQERKEAWKYARKSISRYDQQNDLPEIKRDIRPEYQQIGAHVLQDVIHKVDKAFSAFFLRVKRGEKAGFPRFKGRNWYDSFSYPDQQSWRLEDNRLHLNKIGTIKVKLHRELQGKVKTCTIKREGQHWYACFACEVETEKLPVSYEDVGIDLGVTHFAALSNGEFIESPRYYRKAEKKLQQLQQEVSRKKKKGQGKDCKGNRRKKAIKRLAKQHRKIHNQRKDFHHKASRQLVNRYQVIVFEDLKTANLTRTPKPKQDEVTGQYLPNGASQKAGLNKSILDAGWSMFTEMVSAKAESAGRTVIFVNPSMTSQICSGCGSVVKKELSERWHKCECGCSLDRDTNAAINILTLGRRVQNG